MEWIKEIAEKYSQHVTFKTHEVVVMGNIVTDFTEHNVKELIADAITEALSTQKSTEWISVKDRLPEHGSTVCLIYTKEYGLTIQMWKGYWDSEYPVKEAVVTHWMPLPEPPKE